MTCTCGTLRLIGDVHGDYRALAQCQGEHANSVQIGDMGLGFGMNDPKLNAVINRKNRMRFFRGNHDDPTKCRRHKRHLASGWHEEGFFVVGGGFSIDRKWRTEGLNWWADEEHSARELTMLAQQWADTKPRLALSHEGPPIATDAMFTPRWKFESATAKALQAMWDVWQPEMWVFGHWHRTQERRIGKTMFMCLGEKESRDIHLPSCPSFSSSAKTTLERIADRLKET